MSIGIDISDECSPLLAQLTDNAARQGLLAAVAAAGRDAVKDHFTELALDALHHDSSRELGATRSGVYERAALDTSAAVAGDDAIVSVTGLSGEIITQRFFGGTIKPKNGSKLSLPARTEFYGHSPKEFDRGMFKPLFGRNGVYALALVNDTDRQLVRGPRAGQFQRAKKGETATAGAEVVAFWLVDEVTQDEDKTVIPTQEEFEAAIFTKLDGWAADHNLLVA